MTISNRNDDASTSTTKERTDDIENWSSPHTLSVPRRSVLGTMGSLSLGSAAGCLGIFGGDDDDQPMPTPTRTYGYGEGEYGESGYGGIQP